MSHFTPISALIGGALIGLAASMFWLGNGRIAGISGVFGDVILGARRDRGFRDKALFLLGLIAGGAAFAIFAPRSLGGFGASSTSIFTLAIAGLFVGVGTRMSNGCTSGHGVCGLSRLSLRSLVATLTFMGVAGVTVFLTRH